MSNRKMTLKICIIGESGVGKTSLINRFTKDKFSSQYRITVGADLFSHEMTVDENEYSLQVKLTRFGTRRVRKSSNRSGLPSTGEATHVCWYTTPPMRFLSTSSRRGRRNSSTREESTTLRISPSLSSETNLTEWTKRSIWKLPNSFAKLTEE